MSRSPHQNRERRDSDSRQSGSVPKSWGSGERTRLLASNAARQGTTLQGGRQSFPKRTTSFDQRVEEKRPPLSPGKSPSAVRGHYRSLETEKDKGSSTPGGGNGKRGGDGSFLAMVFVVYVLVALMNRLFQKLQTIPMYNYPVFLNLLTTGAYVPISFAYIIPMIHCGTAITKEQTRIPKYKFLIMGMLDCVASAMQIFAVNFITNAGTIVLVQQSAIPISMAVSKLTLGADYNRAQYIGATIVCAGIFLVLSPQLVGTVNPSSENGHNQVLWSFVMMVSCIPMASSSVYKEYALRDDDIDVVYLNGWVATFQFLLCIPLAIPSAWAIDLPLTDLPQNVYDGWFCFLGHSSVKESDAWSWQGDDPSSTIEKAGSGLRFLMRGLLSTDDGGNFNQVGDDDSSTHRAPLLEDKCQTAPLYVSMYILFNVTYNILVIMILKFGSANMMFLGSTALVPLTNALFCLHFIPGHKPMQMTDFLGLIVIMAGITTYRFLGGKQEVDGKGYKPSTNPYAIEGCQALLQSDYWINKIKAGKIRRTPRLEPRVAYFQKLGITASPPVRYFIL